MDTQTNQDNLSENLLKEKLREALVAIKKLKQELETQQQEVNQEPIAIVGMACRFPGGIRTLEDYWNLLEAGKNVISEVPADRWDHANFYDEDPNKEGKINTKYGGFIEGVDLFDNAYFGISPVEAKYMDPQQRLLLEVSCEALEHAGIDIHALQGSNTGVFMGAAAYDYSHKHLNSPNPQDISTYSITGGEMYAIPGRISYALGLQGPSVLVSTACSSSLVAIHQACQSLQLHESDLALAGGSNLIISPEAFIALSQMGALSVDGQCKAFDAKANGYVRGEGVGAIALKRLSDAERNGDSILAVIKGTAVNQDGKSNGFTAPNIQAQEKLIETALQKSGLDISELDLIEAHGTGTPLGDPIELQAITNVIKKNTIQRVHPLWVGTVKSNFGHTEGAAGIAGVIKMVLSLQHKKIPQSLHFETPNPHYNWSENHIRIPQRTLEWKSKSAPRTGGVSSFGVSGTNAHAILAEYQTPSQELQVAPSQPMHLLPITAQSETALQAYAQGFAEGLESLDEKSLYDFAASARFNKTPHKHRVVLAGRTKEELLERVKLLESDELDHLAAIDAENFSPKVAFVFPGHGSDWIGMGRQLMQEEAVFRENLERCDQVFHPFLNWSILDELHASESENQFSRIDVIQPVTCAIQISLAKLWISKGIAPAGIIGHSMGEVAAAHVAGAITLEAAGQIICLRSQLMHQTKGQGTMAVVGLSVSETQARLQAIQDRVSVAVVNGPSSTVISGEPQAIEDLLEQLETEGVFHRALKIDIASHSVQMESASQELAQTLHTHLKPQDGAIPFYSTVQAEKLNGGALNAEYWQKNLRHPVLFSDTVAQLLEDGFNVFIEISTHPILVNALKQSFEQLEVTAAAVPSLYRSQDESIAFWEAWGKLYALNYELDWQLIFPAAHRRMTLPNYPWQHRHFWIHTSHYTLEKTSSENPSIAWEESNPLSLVDLIRNEVDDGEKLQFVKQAIRKELLKASGYQDEQVMDSSAFNALGIDSMMAMKIKGKLEKVLELSFSTNLFWKYNSIQALGTYLLQRLAFETEPVPEQPFSMPEMPQKDWFIVPKAKREAALQLICFHGAGESPMLYHHWANGFHESIELMNVQLPGRGSRMEEYPYQNIQEFVHDFVPALKQAVHKPYLLFGHSMGGLLAFEVAKRLMHEDFPKPLQLYISATPAYKEPPLVRLSELSTKELIAVFPNLAEEHFPDKEFQQLLINTLRADLHMVDQYAYQAGEPLPIPITVMGGAADKLVPKEQLAGWQRETSEEFELILHPEGSHHYLHEDWQEVISIIQQSVLQHA